MQMTVLFHIFVKQGSQCDYSFEIEQGPLEVLNQVPIESHVLRKPVGCKHCMQRTVLFHIFVKQGSQYDYSFEIE
uniref:Uncharacterized protein n=1 Tax=Nelumbo nucifera TaxID=4432 RepID=A0A822YY89_NELNU|nr:TPA_asm: hypothetical protein HUJ06_008121 [Nelumbo nucifera]